MSEPFHYAHAFSWRFIEEITSHNADYPLFIGLLKEMPVVSRANTYGLIQYSTETGPTGALRPRYRAYFPGYSSIRPYSWSFLPNHISLSETLTDRGWRGRYANIAFSCTLDIESGSNWSETVVGWYAFYGYKASLVWVEELDSPRKLNKAGDILEMTVEALARCPDDYAHTF
jgi:hypothetical protein